MDEKKGKEVAEQKSSEDEIQRSRDASPVSSRSSSGSIAQPSSGKPSSETVEAVGGESISDTSLPKKLSFDECAAEEAVRLIDYQRFVQRKEAESKTSGTTVFLDQPTEETVKEKKNEILHQTLDLVYNIGINTNLPIYFINDAPDARVVYYSSASNVVLHNFIDKSQKLMQGHTNKVSCLNTTEGRQWLVSGDKGIDSTINVWDRRNGLPIKTYFNVFPPYGVNALAFSSNSKFLGVISNEPRQSVVIWEWTVQSEDNKDVPVVSLSLEDKYSSQGSLQFHPDDYHCLISCNSSFVLLYTWTSTEMTFSTLTMGKSSIGSFTKSCFHLNTNKVLTSTTQGNVIIWIKDPDLSEKTDKPLLWHGQWKLLKVVNCAECCITFITISDQHIVTADVKGVIKFFDENLHLLSWLTGYKNVPISSLAFSPFPIRKTEGGIDVPRDLSLQAKPFYCRDFVFCTVKAKIGLVTKHAKFVKLIKRETEQPITCIASHPFKPEICWASQSGLFQIWDYKEKHIYLERNFEEVHVTAIAYDPSGRFLGLGFSAGGIKILDAITMTDLFSPKFLISTYAIRFCAFSSNSIYFATTDDSRALTLVVYLRKDWHIYGRFRAHTNPIVGLFFSNHPDTQSPQLFTVGEDRMMVEYDIWKSTRGRVKLLRRIRLEQMGIPTCAVLYPDITPQTFVLVANNMYKLKLFNVVSLMCQRVSLGPIYGAPISKAVIVPQDPSLPKSPYFMLFAAAGLVGLQILPADGNPYSSVAVIAHPGNVDSLACSYDGKFAFSVDSANACISMWEIHSHILNLVYKLGGEGMDPYFPLIQGGKTGQLFKQLEDYFYYIHIYHEGENTMSERKTSSTVTIQEIPYIMRAIGYFPSEDEIQTMMNEVKYSNNSTSGEFVEEVNIETFLKLYINYRPVFGIMYEDVDAAFEAIIDAEAQKKKYLFREEFLEILQKHGEVMSVKEIFDVLTTLLNIENAETALQNHMKLLEQERPAYLSVQPKEKDVETSKLEEAAIHHVLDEKLPPMIKASLFLKEIMGIDVKVSEESESIMSEADLDEYADGFYVES